MKKSIYGVSGFAICPSDNAKDSSNVATSIGYAEGKKSREVILSSGAVA